MEEDAIRIGLDLHYFWSLTPKQWAKHIKVFNQKEEDRLKEADTLNFVLGKYIAYAVNNPKQYPKKPFTDKEPVELQPISDTEMEKIAMLNTRLMGGVINDSRRITSSNNG